MDLGEGCEVIQDALTKHPNKRTRIYLNIIIDFLKNSSIRPVLDTIYAEAVDEIARRAYLTHRNYRDELTRAGGSFETCHILFDGTVEEIRDETLKIKKTLKHGANIGFNEIRTGVYYWPTTTIILSEGGASFVSVSRRTILETIGLSDSMIKDDMVFFWKFHNLWKIVNDPSSGPSFNSLLPADKRESEADEAKALDRLKNWVTGEEKLGLNDVRDIAAVNPMETDVVNCARLLCFSRGVMVCEYGAPRRFMYIVKEGELCIMRRESDTGKEYELGLKLYPGDFWALDGENVTWLERSQLEIDGKLPATGCDMPTLTEIRNRKRELLDTRQRIRVRKYLFEQYDRHSLVANTQVKLIAIPLENVARNNRLLKNIIAIQTQRYPALLPSCSSHG